MWMFLRKVCDQSIIENQSKFKKYIATLRKENDKSLYENYTINNVNLDEFDEILDDYVIIHKKKFYLYLFNCEFYLVFDNDYKRHIETNYCHNIEDITQIKSYLLNCIDYYKSQGHEFCHNNKMITKSVSDRCNISYQHYLDQPMHMIERQMNLNIARYPHLINSLDQNKNHPLIRKYSHTI